MPVDPQAMARLRAMVSPQNMSAPKDAYLARRTADITSGYDDMVPDADSAEMKLAQIQTQRDTGVGFSRDDLRRGPMAALRQKFGLNQQANDARLQQVQAAGDADVEAAKVGAEAAADRLSYTQGQITSRQDANQAAIMERLNRTQSGQNARQEDQQAFRRSMTPQVNPSTTNLIARQRAALQAQIAKSEPGPVAKMFRRTNPRAAELEMFDNTLAYAQKIANEMPDASAEEALAAMGQTNVSPEELGQIQQFLLMLKGSY